MNENRCPNCDLLNLPDAASCLKCRTPLDPSATTEISAAVTEVYYRGPDQIPNAGSFERPHQYGKNVSRATQFGQPGWNNTQDSKTGSRTFFWYRMLCSVIAVFGIILAVLGILAIISSLGGTADDPAGALRGGILFLVVGLFPALLCLLGVVFPPRSWSWIFGLVLLILMTLSCGLVPFSVPLLVFWFKSETQLFFGRN